MLRQRLRSRTSRLALVGRLLVGLLACALVFFGVMVVLLAVKVSPSTVDSICGYRRAYDYLAGLQEGDLADRTRYIAAGGGVLAFLLFGYLALKELPRPYLARHDLQLVDDQIGVVTVSPRAVERVAESAALEHPEVGAATGRWGDDELAIGLTVCNARETAQTMRDVQAAVVTALQTHGLPVVPINLTLTGYERRTQRELD